MHFDMIDEISDPGPNPTRVDTTAWCWCDGQRVMADASWVRGKGWITRVADGYTTRDAAAPEEGC